MTCNGFQYEEGKEYECNEAKLCEKGFHACENPLDCFNYYYPNKSIYREVEVFDTGERNSDDTKLVGTKIRIGAKIDVAKICKLHFEFINEKCNPTKSGHSKAARSANSATGARSANSATGYGSANSATGARSANSATGDWSANSATGDWSANSATGYGSANSATGYGSANISTGFECKNEGGEASLNAAWGKDSKCKGAVGAYLVLTYWGDFDGERYPLKYAKMIKIDGKKYKADTWYTLDENGKVVEANDE